MSASQLFNLESPYAQWAKNGHSATPAIAFFVLALLAGWGIAVAQESAMFLMLAVVACVFIFLDFRVGVALLIAMLPISNSAYFPRQLLGITGANPFNVLLLGTLTSYFLSLRVGQSVKGFIPKPLFWLYVLPIIAAGIHGMRHVGEITPVLFAFNVLEFHDSFGYLRDLAIKPLLLVVFALLTARAVAKSKDPEGFYIPIVISVCIMSLVVMAFVYFSGYSLEELAGSNARTFFLPLGIHANDLGRLYAVAYGLLLFTFARTERTEMKPILLVAMGAVVLALLLTFSRGAFGGFLLINLIFLISRRSPITFFLFGLLLVGLVVFAPGAVYERLNMGMDGNLNAITAGRTEEIWLPLMPELFKSPIWGNGLLSITWSDAMRSGRMLPVNHPHNAYLQALFDFGVVGTALLLAYFAIVWKAFRRLSKDSRISPGRRGFFEGAAAGLLSLLAAGFVGGSLLPSPEQCYLWLAIGMMYGEHFRLQEASVDHKVAATSNPDRSLHTAT